MKHQPLSALLALAFVGLALLSGAHRRGAVAGAAISGVTGVGSILAMGRFASGGGKAVQRALAVMAVAFLARLLLVSLGTVLVVRAGEDVYAFVVAFFVPYFVFAGIEGAYLHALGRGTGPTA
ncbi:MAG TPA: hypothetical protein VML50_18245 [Anaeromyxobacter sp.]|nr:hypothetical protein [Anaeromyxobacter sp.]